MGINVDAVKEEALLFSEARKVKLAELDATYVSKCQSIEADLTIQGLAVLEILWLSIAPAARLPTPEMTKLIALHQARKAIKTEAAALTTSAEVNAYDIVTNVLWPVEV